MGNLQSTEREISFSEGIFPFLELPAEVRNQTYTYLLSTRHVKAKKTLPSRKDPGPFGYDDPGAMIDCLAERSKYRYNFHMSITCVNRQVRNETHHILRNQNLFVRVISNSRILDISKEALQPIVLARNHEFGHVAMSVHIEVGEDLTDPRFSRTLDQETIFVVACDDLRLLCKALMHLNEKYNLAPILRRLRIRIEESDAKSKPGQSEEFSLNTISVRRLLEPLRFLRGVGSVQIEGNEVSESYKREIEKIITQNLPTHPYLLAAARKVKETGDVAYSFQKHKSAISKYSKALEILEQGSRDEEDSEDTAGPWHSVAFHQLRKLEVQNFRRLYMNELDVATLRLEIERVCDEGEAHSRKYQTLGSDIPSTGVAVSQYLMWHFAISLAGKDTSEIINFGSKLESVLKREPSGSPVRKVLADMQTAWSDFFKEASESQYRDFESQHGDMSALRQYCDRLS